MIEISPNLIEIMAPYKFPIKIRRLYSITQAHYRRVPLLVIELQYHNKNMSPKRKLKIFMCMYITCTYIWYHLPRDNIYIISNGH
jgi:hypothetical protein